MRIAEEFNGLQDGNTMRGTSYDNYPGKQSHPDGSNAF